MCRNFVRLSLSLRNTRIRFIVSMKYCFWMSSIFNCECNKIRNTCIRKGSILYAHMYKYIHVFSRTSINVHVSENEWLKRPTGCVTIVKVPRIYWARYTICEWVCAYVCTCTLYTLYTDDKKSANSLHNRRLYTCVYRKKVGMSDSVYFVCTLCICITYISLSLYVFFGCQIQRTGWDIVDFACQFCDSLR